MAHFAQLDSNNVVTQVIVVGNDDTSDNNGTEVESIGVQLPTTFRDPKSTIGAPGPGSTKYWVAGGGAGGNNNASGPSPGGGPGGPYAGGGGGGKEGTPSRFNGTENTGGGGGGSGYDNNALGGAGGSGLVLIAYPT